MSVNVDDPGSRRLVALGSVAALLVVSSLGSAVVGLHRRTARDRFNLDWRLAQDEDRIAANADKIDRAVELLESVVDDAPA